MAAQSPTTLGRKLTVGSLEEEKNLSTVSLLPLATQHTTMAATGIKSDQQAGGEQEQALIEIHIIRWNS